MSFRKQENREIRSLAGGGYNSVPSTVARCYDFRKPGGYLGNVGLSAAGIPAAVMAAPMIPFLNDAELESILEAAAGAGAAGASYILLRLPLELKELFAEWLDAHAPGKARHVLNMVRESRGGRLYDSDFSTRMRGTGAYADLLARRFQLACRRLGLNRARGALRRLDTTRFRPPGGEQLRLL